MVKRENNVQERKSLFRYMMLFVFNLEGDLSRNFNAMAKDVTTAA